MDEDEPSSSPVMPSPTISRQKAAHSSLKPKSSASRTEGSGALDTEMDEDDEDDMPLAGRVSTEKEGIAEGNGRKARWGR